jgi:hypothetical protein
VSRGGFRIGQSWAVRRLSRRLLEILRKPMRYLSSAGIDSNWTEVRMGGLPNKSVDLDDVVFLGFDVV